MAQILIRNLDPKTVARLKKRAKDQGRSLQAEVKRIIESAADEQMTWEGFRKWSDKFRAKLAGRKMPGSLDIIREGRNR